VSGETIEFAGDEDVFHFTAQPGQYFNLFAQVTAPSGPPLLLQVYDGGDTVIKTLATEPGPGGLFDHGSGRFQTPVSGTVRVRVSVPSGARDYPYRLYLYQIDTLPEHTAANLVVGDSIVGERLELPGDIDLYHLTSTGSNAISLRTRKADTDPTAFYLTISNQPGVFVYGNALPFQADSAGDSVGVAAGYPVPAGTYVMRVTDEFGIPRPGARYDLSTAAVSYGPEGVSPTIGMGQVVNESISPFGDWDVYHFQGARDQRYVVTADSLPGHPRPGIIVEDSLGQQLVGLPSLELPAGSIAFDASANGKYSVLLSGPTGPYRFHVDVVDTLPEHVAPAWSVGDSVSAESIDRAGDVDRFTFTGSPGTEVQVRATSNPPVTNNDTRLRYQLLFPSGDSIQASSSENGPGIPPVVIPASGVIRVQVEQVRGPYGGFDLTALGPYALEVDPINRAPETVPAALTLGDTVTTESIDPAGDIDEFTFNGTAGQHIHVHVFPNDFAEIIDLSTLQSVTATTQGSEAFGTLPTTGQYLVRVTGVAYWISHGPYQLLVEQVP
jgi:hypothetical protein